jgi:hypothetical protein
LIGAYKQPEFKTVVRTPIDLQGRCPEYGSVFKAPFPITLPNKAEDKRSVANQLKYSACSPAGFTPYNCAHFMLNSNSLQLIPANVRISRKPWLE